MADYTDIFIMAPFYFGYVWAADKFCKKYLGTTKRNEWLFLFFSFAGWLFSDIMSRQYPAFYIFAVMLNHVLFIGLVLLLFQSDREKRILAVSMLIMIERLAGNFCASFLSCLVLVFRHTVRGISEPFTNDWENGVIGCASYCFVMLAVWFMIRGLGHIFCGRRGRWYVVLAVPLLMVLVVVDLVGWGASHGIMVRSGGDLGLYYDQIFSHTGILLLTLLILSAAGFYVFGMDRIYREQEKGRQYHSQIAVYKMLKEQYSQSERLRHDMKNHIIALSGLFQSKEWEKLGSYLNKLEEAALEHRGELTGNKAVDALLYDKRKWAERGNIRWECDVQIPAGCSINEFDLCVLFGNLLDNALEACGRIPGDGLRFVHIKAGVVKKCFLIEIQNSMDRTEKFDNIRISDGVTGKDDPQGHGIGLSNVKDVVNRYHGVIKIETGDAVFMVSVLIPSGTS